MHKILATFRFFGYFIDTGFVMRKVFFLLCVCAAQFLAAETFEFLFENGEKYRINSFVTEDVYINMNFSHTAEISNRITVDVSDVQTDPESSALFTCTFMTSEKHAHDVRFAWSKQYPSIFRRNSRGEYQIGKAYFMPVVRNVPVFPAHDVQAGDTWTGEGHEAHDFTETFGLQEPFIVPFTVTYRYVGEIKKDGRILHLITAEYQLMYDLPPELILKSKKQAAVFPVTTMGTSKQNLYWDSSVGNLVDYDESFSIRLILNTGDVYDFIGTAHAKVTGLENFNRKKTLAEVKKQLNKLDLRNITVKESKEGITISIENIQFLPDSAELVQSEKEKLDRIAEVLKAYSERDLLITGHTALADTPEARQKLSVERANAVAQYLIEKKVREDHRIFTQGFGAERPIAPNTTEKNRAKNRRVEITIMDN